VPKNYKDQFKLLLSYRKKLGDTFLETYSMDTIG